jgi:hypothetical protein
VFLAKIAVLKISNDSARVLDREASEFVSQAIFAVFNPIEDLTLGILCLWENGVAIDTQGGV